MIEKYRNIHDSVNSMFDRWIRDRQNLGCLTADTYPTHGINLQTSNRRRWQRHDNGRYVSCVISLGLKVEDKSHRVTNNICSTMTSRHISPSMTNLTSNITFGRWQECLPKDIMFDTKLESWLWRYKRYQRIVPVKCLSADLLSVTYFSFISKPN